ncbi:ABC transporter permease [Roseateles aquatilis]|uniref:ABC transporter permease n=1 Tax=Roseateles aquatilis TaxID=431061 RepID=A0A246JEZ4_9BURK|nr:FtsX-like permease family protein [Roseateles aquatilis]OWQ91254.1 ABC transporter permease [Roseateles aquatilis]
MSAHPSPTSAVSSAVPSAAEPRPRRRPPSLWRQSALQTWRDARAGELHLLILALMLAVAAVCAVAFLSDRLDQGLRRDAAQLLGGDAVVASDQPTPAPVRELAARLGLRTVDTLNFPSMARATEAQGGGSRLVAVKAVGETYPLRGKLALKDGRQAGAPAPGTVWADAGVLSALGLKVGDALLLGDSTLKITGEIANEPDRGAGFLNFAPRVMLAQADLAATALIQPASRVTYRFAVIGQDTAVKQFNAESQKQMKASNWRGVRLESLDTGRPEMRQTLDRATKFLNLVALLAALLAAIAVALAAREFANRHLDDCAMLRVLGQPQRRLTWVFTLEFATIGLIASAAGVLLGFLLHYGFISLLAGLISVDLPAPGIWPVLLGLGMGMSLLLGFGLPPVLQLAAVPPLRVIRRELGRPKMGSIVVLLAGVVGFAAVLTALSADWRLGLVATGGFAVALGFFALLAWLAVLGLRRVVPQAGAPRWLLLATRQVAARPAFAVLQVGSLSLGLLALALLVLMRTDLIESWRAATPANAPDRFVINIQPEQGAGFRGDLERAGVKDFDWYPMIRGRLVAINGEAVRANQFSEERAQRLVEREFNLSHSAALPTHNQLTAGTWAPEDKDGVSVEQGLADQLGLKLGDRVRFDIAGVIVDSKITTLRKVDWGSMRVNFFVLYPRAAMPELPVSYISAYRSPTGEGAPAALDRKLVNEFPNLTLIDVSAELRQIQQVLEQVIMAVQLLFTVALALGVVVLLVAAVGSRDARTREFALMRAFGASSKLMAAVQRAELLGLGALAGLLAGLAAQALGWAITHYAFDFEWQFKPGVLIGTTLGGAVLAQLAGWWALRGVLQRPVVQTLREADTN